jgi:hypothetical protein
VCEKQNGCNLHAYVMSINAGAVKEEETYSGETWKIE